MSAFIAALGVNVTIGRWFPMHRTDFYGDFMQASRFDSLAEKGEVYDKFIQAGGPQTQMALYGDLMICRDGPTSLYDAAGGSTGGWTARRTDFARAKPVALGQFSLGTLPRRENHRGGEGIAICCTSEARQ